MYRIQITAPLLFRYKAQFSGALQNILEAVSVLTAYFLVVESSILVSKLCLSVDVKSK